MNFSRNIINPKTKSSMTQDQILFKKYLSTQFSGLIDPIGVKYLDYIVVEPEGPLWNMLDYPTNSLNEEYFEWLELLKSVENAKNNFVFVELGAGFGKWSARAYKACLLNNINNIRLIVVEGEPQHAQWLKEHLRYNNIPSNSIIFEEALISNYDGTGEIMVYDGNGLNGSRTSKNWYGQYHIPSANKEDILIRNTYLDKELLVDRHGICRVVCNTITIETLLKTIPIVDLLNIDIQGSEYISIHKNLEIINTKVKKLYVSTHSTEIDNLLYNMMASLNWKCIHAYPFQFQGDTEFGYIKFGDGVQVWENPKYFEK
jgi:FkbM family methyltransferase